jgi:SAM-dependent methyltransferase
MDLSSYYDEAYAALSRYPVSGELRDRVERESRGLLNLVDENKERFMASKAWEGLRVVELGAGMGGLSLQLARRGADVTVVDFSSHALGLARELAQKEQLTITTLKVDLGRPDAELDGQYDLMIDSHLLHCLPLEPQRLTYLQLIREHLTSDGIFVGETMVHRKKLFIPPGYMFDQNNILWQMFAQWVPVRKIADSMKVEEEFRAAGLAIHYFYYYANYAMAPSPDFWDIPNDILPASVRFAVKKA